MKKEHKKETDKKRHATIFANSSFKYLPTTLSVLKMLQKMV